MQFAIKKEETTKIILVSVFKIIGLGFLFLLLFFATIRNTINPFRYGLYSSLCFLNYNIYILSISFLLAGLGLGFDISNMVCNLFVVLFTTICCLVFKKKNIRVKSYIAGILYVVSVLPNFYFCNSGSDMVATLIETVIGVVFMISCMMFISSVVRRKYALKLNTDEKVCGAVLIIALFAGLSNVDLSVDFVRFFATTIILFLSLNSNGFSIPVGVCMGIGVSLGLGEVSYIALFSFMAIITTVFRENKFYAFLSIVLADVLLGLYFNSFLSYGLVNILSVIVGGLVYQFIPRKTINKISNILFVENSNSTSKSLVLKNKLILSNKLSATADVFYELDKTFRKLTKGNLPIEDAKKMITVEIIQSTCEGCKNKQECFRRLGESAKEIFTNLTNVGFEKGKVSLVDLPQYLTSRCQNLNNLVSNTNSLLNQYHEYSGMINNLDASKLLIAEQLAGVSHILKNLAISTGKEIKFDKEKEERIREELIYNNIIIQDIIVFDSDFETCNISVVLKETDVGDEKLISVINKVCKTNFVIDEIIPADILDYVVVNLKTAPAYDITFGISQATKGESDVSGDTFSLTRLDNDKYLVCLCDGMGSDDNAFETSSTAIGLIENFYKAGYDSSIIIPSVNKLLNLGRSDVFSAIDICVVDLKSAITDMIKLGACVGFIKQEETTTIVESGALPIGILEEVKPKITKTALNSGDMIVLVSDGIVDAFGEEEKIKNYITKNTTTNPQTLADNILQTAKEFNKNFPKDDMTVLVGKIYYA